MSQTKKKQHYIWRNYLAAWTQDNTTTGKIWCLRDNKVFQPSLLNIAHENYFYEVKELSQKERTLIYELAIKNTTGIQRQINEQWLKLYCAPYDYADEIASLGYLSPDYTESFEIKQDQLFRQWSIEHIEMLHCQIESSGIPYISLLRQNSLDFWKAEIDREKFGFFLANQYFRTKKMRDALVSSMKTTKEIVVGFNDIHPENIWLPLSLILASNVGIQIAHGFLAIIMLTDDASFIVGDQPVINTYSTFDAKTVPEKVEFFYPITPNSALLLTEDPKYTNGQTINISSDEVLRYNLLEQKSAREMIFAKEKEQLNSFISLT